MDELHGRRQPDVTQTLVAADLRGSQRQHRPQSFAAGIDDVTSQLGDERHVRAHALEDQRVDVLQVGFHEPEKALNRPFGLSGPFVKSLDGTQDV